MDVRELKSFTDNPYWVEVCKVEGGSFGLDDDAVWQPAFYPIKAMLAASELGVADPFVESLSREVLVEKFAWSIPDPGSLEFIKGSFPSGASFVECGAGTGYWAYQLTQLGFDVTAFDAAYRDELWFPVQKGGVDDVAVSSAGVLFLCWPPYGTSMAFDALSAFKGDSLLYVGENYGGCTGDDAFFDLLSEEWVFEGSHSGVNYFGIHDSVNVYSRRV